MPIIGVMSSHVNIKPRFNREKGSYKKFEQDEVAVAVAVDGKSGGAPVAKVSTGDAGDSTAAITEWPIGLRNAITSQFDIAPNEKSAKAYLQAHAWPKGMQTTILKSSQKIPIRFMIVDDSGSMGTTDGKRTVGTGAQTKVIDCTRWSEVTASLIFHAELAEAMEAATEFRLLNGSDPIIVGLKSDRSGDSLRFLREVLADPPGGKTPLWTQIAGVVQEIMSIQDSLRAKGKRAAVIIFTDGLATDGDVAAALKPLEDLPVWVVIRLCTDEKEVLLYWEGVDKVLELELDVLDDLVRDAEKISHSNPWLNYGEALHRLREFGTVFKELDVINESKLTSEQMRAVVATM